MRLTAKNIAHAMGIAGLRAEKAEREKNGDNLDKPSPPTDEELKPTVEELKLMLGDSSEAFLSNPEAFTPPFFKI
jgi:hypothetical protein